MQRKFDAKVNDAERLMRTELARVQTEAQKQSFERNGFEEYEFITNGGCCPICDALDGKHFKVKDMMPGKNAPPMHPNCRCSIAAYEDSEEYEAWLDYLDKGGTTEEWENLKEETVVKSSESSKIKTKDRFNSRDDPMYEIMGSAKENNEEELQEILNHLNELGVSIKYRKGQYGYEIIGKEIPGEIVIDEDASLSAWGHEYQHALSDYRAGWSSKRILKKPKARYRREVEAYQVEIDIAKKLGRDDMVRRLEANLERERRKIYGE